MDYFSQDDIRSIELTAAKIEKILFNPIKDTSGAQKNILSETLLSCNDVITGMKLFNIKQINIQDETT